MYNSLLDVYYVVKSSGEFVTQRGNGSATDALNARSNPNALQLDWIARRLYWVEVIIVH